MSLIFNTNTGSTYTPVAESKYGVGLNAALMHVYENEVNYTAMMKSVGIAEFKYCTENAGKDLFLNEAGAFSGFLAKVKAFFKKVIEKIKALFHAFMAKINSFIMSDKDFLKKYEKEIVNKKIKDLKFKGYKKLFGAKDFDTNITADIKASVDKATSGYENEYTKDNANNNFFRDTLRKDIEKVIATKRGVLAGTNNELDEAEFREELHKKFYGGYKEEIEVTSADITNAINVVKNASDLVKSAEKVRDKIIGDIDEFVKELDRVDKNTSDDELEKQYKKSMKDNDGLEHVGNKNMAHQIAGARINIAKGYSNAYTVYFGALIGAFKDANRQAKALCVKVISHKVKNESSTYAESGVPFADVKLV